MAQSEMTVVELREWLRSWVCRATGLDLSKVTDDRSLEEYGLSSRDAVTLSADLEDLLGRPLDATVAYQHPTIETLAEYVINGPVELDEPTDLHTFRERGAGMEFDVAVIGMATRFPGGADSPEAMWELLASGRDATGPRPATRWSEWAGDAYVQQVLAEAPDHGGWLEDSEVRDFDAEFFGMSPREAEMVDPQQRLALELTWEALENAHLPASDLKGREVGVFIGSSSSDYQVFLTSDSAAASPYAVTGASNSIISNRVSYTFDFRGPSMTLDTACSTSLVTVHEAVNSLRLHESDLAVAGGVNMMLAPAATMGFAKTGAALSPDGRIKAFSSDADGICRAEGGGVFILKRLSEAERDGDEILAVIKGSAVNSDGRSNGMTAPNPDAQVAVLRQAYADAGADLIFTEALHTPADFEKFRAAVDVPLLANMTEFGKSELLSAKQLEDLGFNAVIYPVTTLRIAMGQVEEALAEIAATGTQTGWVDRMQHRSRLYELLRYNEYNAFDQEVFTYSADTYQPTFQN